MQHCLQPSKQKPGKLGKIALRDNDMYSSSNRNKALTLKKHHQNLHTDKFNPIEQLTQQIKYLSSNPV